jgi:hypothetical protein
MHILGLPREGPTGHRRAGNLEVTHLAYIATYDWGRYRLDLGSTLKELPMNAIFFHCFALQPGRTTTVLTYAFTCLLPLITIHHCLYRSDQSWPFNLITKCETIRTVNEQLRKIQPSNDLLILKSNLPRLLVEVNSKPKKEGPEEDLIRMLLTGAAIVRFANKYLGTFKAKDFVLFAIYISDGGRVARYSLFQDPNNPEVC